MHSKARESDWFHSLCWIKRAILLRTHLESLSSWQNCFVPSFGHRGKTDEDDNFDPLPMFSGDHSLFEVPTVANVQAALEPLCGRLKMGKATGPEGAPASWRGGIMTPVPKQTKKPMGQDNARGVLLRSTLGKLHAKCLRSDATRHVQSAVLPTQLGGFPSKTIEFGNHLVNQRASVCRQ